jgi:hypothetical protein
VHVRDQPIDEIVDVDVLANLGIRRRRLEPRGRDVLGRLPGFARSVVGIDRLDDVPLVFEPAVVRGSHLGVGQLDHVVEAPVQAVEVDVEEAAVGRDLAHVDLRVAHPLVADVVRARDPEAPRLVVARAQAKLVEARDRRVGEQRVLELGRPVVGLERQPQRLLQVLHAAEPALDARAAVDLKAGRAVGKNQLGRSAALPLAAAPARVRIDSVLGAEEIVDVHHDRDRGHGAEVVDDRTRIARVVDDLGIHLIVGGETFGREAGARLMDHVSEEDVGVRDRWGRQQWWRQATARIVAVVVTGTAPA